VSKSKNQTARLFAIENIIWHLIFQVGNLMSPEEVMSIFFFFSDKFTLKGFQEVIVIDFLYGTTNEQLNGIRLTRNTYAKIISVSKYIVHIGVE
jgi:hypothetical protein